MVLRLPWQRSSPPRAIPAAAPAPIITTRDMRRAVEFVATPAITPCRQSSPPYPPRKRGRVGWGDIGCLLTTTYSQGDIRDDLVFGHRSSGRAGATDEPLPETRMRSAASKSAAAVRCSGCRVCVDQAGACRTAPLPILKSGGSSKRLILVHRR